MLLSTFLHHMKKAKGVRITKDWLLFLKPCELYNTETEETISFKSLDDAFKFEIEGKTIKEIVDDADMSLFTVQCDGGSGSGSGAKTFKPSGSGQKPKLRSDLPARMNNVIKTKNVETAIQEFRKKHQNDNKESMIGVDKDGFVQQYTHGAKHSVAWKDEYENALVIHNHPSNSHFSDRDLLNLSTTKTRGVVATTKDGYFMVEKGTHFKSNEWAKAIRTAKMKGDNYNDAMDRWLKKNQKKYGYTYANVRD